MDKRRHLTWFASAGLPWVAVGIVAAACGSDSRPRVSVQQEQGGNGAQLSTSAGQGSGGAPAAGAAMGGAASPSASLSPDAGGGIVYSRPQVAVQPPEVGDSLLDEDASQLPLVFPPDAGLVPDVPGVAVGEEQQVGTGRTSVCFHVDMTEGTYLMVPNNDSPDERLERVATFGLSEQGFELFAFFPWSVAFVDPEEAPSYLPTDQVTTVVAQREEVALQLRFQVQGNEVAMLSVEVLSL